MLHKDGELTKITQGTTLADFKVKNLPSSFNNPVDIYASETTQNLYIADPENKRIVVLNSEGEFIKQLNADEFANISSLYIEEKSKKGYILSNNKIYQFGL